MILPEDKQRLVVGYKQVKKAALQNACTKIFVADDCSQSIIDDIKASANGAEVIAVATMRELGQLCGIDVSASCAAIRK